MIGIKHFMKAFFIEKTSYEILEQLTIESKALRLINFLNHLSVCVVSLY
jgi:hypothetical protein